MDITMSPALGVRKLNRSFGQLNLSSKSQFLRDRLKLIRQAGKASPETLHQIENHLNSITQESNPIGQWNAYELAYEGYIPLAPDDDLLGLFLDLRSRTDLLDEGNQEVWSKLKLEQMEQDLRLGHAGSTLRIEIAALARAIHECGVRKKRDSEIRMRIVRRTLYLTAFLCVLLIASLLWMELRKVPVESPWQFVVTAGFGAIGALVNATVQLRRRHLVSNDLQADQASVLFRPWWWPCSCNCVLSIFRSCMSIFPPIAPWRRRPPTSLALPAAWLKNPSSGCSSGNEPEPQSALPALKHSPKSTTGFRRNPLDS